MNALDGQAHSQSFGIKWMYQMELIEDPELISNLKLNILMVSRSIQDVELLSIHNFGRKEMLVWLDVNWWGSTFLTKRLEENVLGVVSKLLPSFKLRVTLDRSILDKALVNVQKFTRAQCFNLEEC